MSTEPCVIEGCTDNSYAPAGTHSICKEHFLQFLAWRKKKGGLSFFKKYSAMNMEDRNGVVQEWTESFTSATSS